MGQPAFLTPFELKNGATFPRPGGGCGVRDAHVYFPVSGGDLRKCQFVVSVHNFMNVYSLDSVFYIVFQPEKDRQKPQNALIFVEI